MKPAGYRWTCSVARRRTTPAKRHKVELEANKQSAAIHLHHPRTGQLHLQWEGCLAHNLPCEFLKQDRVNNRQSTTDWQAGREDVGPLAIAQPAPQELAPELHPMLSVERDGSVDISLVRKAAENACTASQCKIQEQEHELAVLPPEQGGERDASQIL